MEKFADLVVRRRFWFLLIIGLLTVFFASQVRHLKIVIDPSAMLPKQHPNVIGTTAAENLFGSKYVVVVGVGATNGGTALQPGVLQVVADLTRDLASVPGVKAHTLQSLTAQKTKSISGTKNEMVVEPMLELPITPASISALRRHLADNPVYQNTVVSADQTLVSVSFSVDVGPKGFREVMDKVQLVLDKAESATVHISASGTAVFFANVERLSQRMAFLFPIALVLIGLIHLEAFRTKQGLLLPLVTALLAVIWSLGIMGTAKVTMDAFNATTPILILAIAAGHAVQILARYYEEYERLVGLHPHDPLDSLNDRAIVASLAKMSPVMITAGTVAALGLFSLITFDIATIRTFGVFTGLGILSALLIELTFIPALRSYLPAPRPGARSLASSTSGRDGRVWDRLTAGLTSLVTRRYRSILAAFAVLAMVAGLAMTHINRENSTKSYFGEAMKLRQEDNFLNSKLAGTNTLYVVFQGSRADQMKDPVVLRAIADAQAFIATLPDVGKTISIVDLLKQMHRALNGGNKQYYVIPPTADMVSQYLLLYSMSGQPTDFDPYIDYQYQNANLLVWMKNDSSKYAETIVRQIREHVQAGLPPGVTIQIGGSVPQTSALSETLVDGKIRNIAQMMAFVFVAGMLVFRSLLAGLYLVLPLIFTVLVNFGVMGITGIPLNTPNSVSSAMAIGIGADYAIYLLYRIREELQRTSDVDIALHRALRTAGKAVVYVASAIMGGYAVLMLSFDFFVHIWFGLLIVLSMLVSATAALVLIPSLIKLHVPRFLQRGYSGWRKTSPADAVSQSIKTVEPTVNAGGATLRGGVGLAGSLLVTIVVAWLASPATVFAAEAAELRAEEWMEKSYQATRLNSSLSEATFRLTSASGQERVRKMFAATKLQADGATQRRVIRFLAPGDVRNTTTLLLENSGKEDEIWVYLPTLKKARRVAGSNKKNSFVGTDLSFGDLVGHKAQNWNHKLLRQENLQGASTTVVESIPGTAEIADESGYSKRISWIALHSYVSLKTEFYDVAGNLLKTVENSELKLLDEGRRKYQPMRIFVRNHQTGHSTLLTMDRFEGNVPVKDDYFGSAYLEQEE